MRLTPVRTLKITNAVFVVVVNSMSLEEINPTSEKMFWRKCFRKIFWRKYLRKYVLVKMFSEKTFLGKMFLEKMVWRKCFGENGLGKMFWERTFWEKCFRRKWFGKNVLGKMFWEKTFWENGLDSVIKDEI